MKHLDLKQIWMQGYVRRKLVQVEWIPRKENPADALTHVSGELFGHMDRLGQIFPAADPVGETASEGGCWKSDAPPITSAIFCCSESGDCIRSFTCRFRKCCS